MESIREFPIEKITYGVIQYRNFTANIQTFTNCIQINGHSIRIQAEPCESVEAVRIHQILEKARIQASVSLEWCNDDEFKDICELLKLSDLCNFGNVNSRLRAIAQETFRKIHRKTDGNVAASVVLDDITYFRLHYNNSVGHHF